MEIGRPVRFAFAGHLAGLYYFFRSVPSSHQARGDRLGTTTAGSWTTEFDGSDVGLGGNSQLDVYGAWYDEANNSYYLTFRGSFALTGASGDAADIVECSSFVGGTSSSCNFSLFWDSSAAGLTGETTDGIFIDRP